MRTCPSTGTTCYADVCRTWPCATAAEHAAHGAQRDDEHRKRFLAAPTPSAPRPEPMAPAIPADDPEPDFHIEGGP